VLVRQSAVVPEIKVMPRGDPPGDLLERKAESLSAAAW
jgi:hypothetical protein